MNVYTVDKAAPVARGARSALYQLYVFTRIWGRALRRPSRYGFAGGLRPCATLYFTVSGIIYDDNESINNSRSHKNTPGAGAKPPKRSPRTSAPREWRGRAAWLAAQRPSVPGGATPSATPPLSARTPHILHRPSFGTLLKQKKQVELNGQEGRVKPVVVDYWGWLYRLGLSPP